MEICYEKTNASFPRGILLSMDSFTVLYLDKTSQWVQAIDIKTSINMWQEITIKEFWESTSVCEIFATVQRGLRTLLITFHVF